MPLDLEALVAKSKEVNQPKAADPSAGSLPQVDRDRIRKDQSIDPSSGSSVKPDKATALNIFKTFRSRQVDNGVRSITQGSRVSDVITRLTEVENQNKILADTVDRQAEIIKALEAKISTQSQHSRNNNSVGVSSWTSFGPGARSAEFSASTNSQALTEEQYEQRTQDFERYWDSKISKLLTQISQGAPQSVWVRTAQENINILLDPNNSWMTESHRDINFLRLMHALPNGLGNSVLNQVGRDFNGSQANYYIATRNELEKYRGNTTGSSRSSQNTRRGNDSFSNFVQRGIGGAVSTSRDNRNAFLETIRRNIQQPGAELWNWRAAFNQARQDIFRINKFFNPNARPPH
ncbi:MAG: hypothetical protein KDD56_08580 [Bdellovibrionales bacterium]|nr:hypothetical protein [Bdellovibrionales bacterium]